MLKKFGLVVMGVTASLAAVAPLASAADNGHGDCTSVSDGKGNSGQVDTCNLSFQNFGQGNTFNGIPIP